MDCIEALDVLSQALRFPDLCGTQFSPSDDGSLKVHSPCGFPLYRPVSQQSQPTRCDRFAGLLCLYILQTLIQYVGNLLFARVVLQYC